MILPYSSIHKGKAKKRVPAKPRKRVKVAPIKTFPDGREKCMTTYQWNLRRLEVLIRDGGGCVLCGKRLELCDAEIDHKRKRSLGRDDRLANLQTLCSTCHRKKHNQ